MMTILLPGQGYGVNDVLDEIDTDKLRNLSETAQKVTVEVKLPKFKMEYKRTLNKDLVGMGMEKAFSPLAEFPELFEGSEGLKISRVLHQSFIEVNEEGSEAAAATVVEIDLVSLPSNPKPQRFTIDKPFVFFIMEKHTNTILFAGKMMQPE